MKTVAIAMQKGGSGKTTTTVNLAALADGERKLISESAKKIAESVISGRKSGAEMARLYNISSPTVSRIVAQHRSGLTCSFVQIVW